MVTENARVETLARGEDVKFCVQCIINGYDEHCVIRAFSIDHAEEVAPEIERLVKPVYRKAYRAGFASCQSAMRDAIELSR
ncbi:MAG: hypothetical protein ACK5PB_22560 [Pirellula sp.]